MVKETVKTRSGTVYDLDEPMFSIRQLLPLIDTTIGYEDAGLYGRILLWDFLDEPINLQRLTELSTTGKRGICKSSKTLQEGGFIEIMRERVEVDGSIRMTGRQLWLPTPNRNGRGIEVPRKESAKLLMERFGKPQLNPHNHTVENMGMSWEGMAETGCFDVKPQVVPYNHDGAITEMSCGNIDIDVHDTQNQDITPDESPQSQQCDYGDEQEKQAIQAIKPQVNPKITPPGTRRVSWYYIPDENIIPGESPYSDSQDMGPENTKPQVVPHNHTFSGQQGFEGGVFPGESPQSHRRDSGKEEEYPLDISQLCGASSGVTPTMDVWDCIPELANAIHDKDGNFNLNAMRAASQSYVRKYVDEGDFSAVFMRVYKMASDKRYAVDQCKMFGMMLDAVACVAGDKAHKLKQAVDMMLAMTYPEGLPTEWLYENVGELLLRVSESDRWNSFG